MVKKEFLIGIVAVITILIFIWGYGFLKQSDLFNSRRVFYSVYTHVDGINSDRPVLINGYQVGKVDAVYFHPDQSGKLVVRFYVDEDIEFSKNTIAKITSTDLLGTKAMDLILSPGAVAVSGDTLESGLDLSIGEEVNRQVAPIKKKAEEMMAQLDTVMLYIRALLDEKTRQNVVATFQNVQETFESLNSTVKSLDRILANNEDNLGRIMSNLESITKTMRDSNDDLANVFDNMSSISDSLAKLNVAETMANLNATLASFDELMRKANAGEGSLGKLLNDEALYVNLNNTNQQLQLLLEDMRLNPQRYVRFSIFGNNKPYEEPKTKE